MHDVRESTQTTGDGYEFQLVLGHGRTLQLMFPREPNMAECR